MHGYVRKMSFKRKVTNRLPTQERFKLIVGHWGTNPGCCGAIGIAEKRSKSLPCMKHQLLSIMIVGKEGSVRAGEVIWYEIHRHGLESHHHR